MATKSKKVKGKDDEVLEIKPIDKPIEPTIEPEEEIDTPTEETPKEEEKKKDEEPATEPETETPKEEAPKEEEDVKEEEKVEDKKEEVEEVKEDEPTKEPEESVDLSVDTPESSEPKKPSHKGLVLSLLATLIVGGALTGGILYSRTSLDTRSKAAAPEDTSSDSGLVKDSSDVGSVTPTSTPETTPTAEELDLTEYSISILNGSGVAGQAGIVNDLLEEAGFEDLSTGNAESYDYETTEVSLTENTPKGIFDIISQTLENDYEVKEADPLGEDSNYDILIIVGQN